MLNQLLYIALGTLLASAKPFLFITYSYLFPSGTRNLTKFIYFFIYFCEYSGEKETLQGILVTEKDASTRFSHMNLVNVVNVEIL